MDFHLYVVDQILNNNRESDIKMHFCNIKQQFEREVRDGCFFLVKKGFVYIYDSVVMTKKRQKKEKRTDHSTNNVRRKKVLSLTMTNLMTHGKPTMVEVGIAQIIFIHLGHATHDGIPHY